MPRTQQKWLWLRKLWHYLKTAWNSVGSYVEQIKIIFSVLAAVYIIYEYNSNLREAAVKQTMEFHARYSKDEVLKAHLDLDGLLLDPETQKLLAAAPKPSEKITELIQAKKFERNVLILADFFGQLTTCVQSGVCHLEAACAVFKDRVIAHWHNYYDLFQRWGTWGQNLMKPTFEFFNTKCG